MRKFILAALLLVAVPALAQDGGALAFLQQIYGQYEKTADGVDIRSAGAAQRYFTPAVARLMEADAAEAARNKQSGRLDFDPFIGGQFWAPTKVALTVAPRTQGRSGGRHGALYRHGRNEGGRRHARSRQDCRRLADRRHALGQRARHAGEDPFGEAVAGSYSRPFRFATASASRQRISHIMVTPTSAVLPLMSKGGETSTTSPPTRFRPRSMRCASWGV